MCINYENLLIVDIGAQFQERLFLKGGLAFEKIILISSWNQ